jgi:hypothetical protein
VSEGRKKREKVERDEKLKSEKKFIDILPTHKCGGFLFMVHRSPLAISGCSSIVEAVFSPCFPSCEADPFCPKVLFCHSIPRIPMPFLRMLIAAFVSRQISIPQLGHE